MILQILLVEDDSDKLRRILVELQHVPGCGLDNIDQARSATEAKRFLKEKQCDLLILDIALPDRPDEPPSPTTGIELLQELVDRDAQYYRPREIVGLTGFAEIRERAAGALCRGPLDGHSVRSGVGLLGGTAAAQGQLHLTESKVAACP
jgi:CheY-like chemotaxis protein